MMKVDQQLQNRMREELSDMGLLNNNQKDTRQGNNPDNPACYCDLRTSEPACKCDLRSGMEQTIQKCECGDSITKDDLELIAYTLKIILAKLDVIEYKMNSR
jgi:hypothetical protein